MSFLDIRVFDGDAERDDFAGCIFLGVSETIGRVQGIPVVDRITIRDPEGERRVLTEADFGHPVIVSVDNRRSFLGRPAWWIASAESVAEATADAEPAPESEAVRVA